MIASLFAMSLCSQDPQELYEQKLKSEFLSRADWLTDYDEARERARGEKRLIFAYFTTTGD